MPRAALGLRFERGERRRRRQASPLEVGANVRVAVAPFGESSGADDGGPVVVEIPEPRKPVEGFPALLLGEAALFEPRVELRARAVGGAESPERDLLGPWFSS